MKDLRKSVEEIWDNRELLAQRVADIERVVELLDKGELRCAEPTADGDWIVNEWVKKAVIMYFPTQKMRTMEAGE